MKSRIELGVQYVVKKKISQTIPTGKGLSMYYSNSTSPTTSGSTSWWLRSPYYQQFNIYKPSKVRYIFRSAPLSPTPPKEELQQMTDEEFNVAFNDLLFGGKQEESNV